MMPILSGAHKGKRNEAADAGFADTALISVQYLWTTAISNRLLMLILLGDEYDNGGNLCLINKLKYLLLF